MKKIICVIFAMLFIFSIDANEKKPATPFLTGLVSTGAYERDGCYSKDMNEFYFSRMFYGQQVILKISKNLNGEWQEPEVAEFSGQYSDSSPFLSSDGNTLFFSSNRPVDIDNKKPKDFDLYFVKKNETGWTEVNRFSRVINSPRGEYYPSIAQNGNLYFCSHPKDDSTKIHIYKSEFKDGVYHEAIILGNEINSESSEVNPYISPDESYLLFTSYRSGAGDIYISYRRGNNWSKAEKLPAPINSKWRDYSPSVSPDKKYLIFSSNRIPYGNFWEKKRDYKQITSIFRGPSNGMMDIYMIRINDLKNSFNIK